VATLTPPQLPTPLSMRVEATTVALADLFALLPIVKRVDAVTIDWVSPTMRHAVRVLNCLSAMSATLR
jgi:D-amino peptidase